MSKSNSKFPLSKITFPLAKIQFRLVKIELPLAQFHSFYYLIEYKHLLRKKMECTKLN